MASSLNRWTGIGRLGQDPTTKTHGNKKVVNFSVACNNEWRDNNGEKKQKTEWIKVVIWDKGAEIAEKYLKQGQLVYIEGPLQNSEWTNSKGDRITTTQCNCFNFQMLDSLNKKPQTPTAYPKPPAELALK